MTDRKTPPGGPMARIFRTSPDVLLPAQDELNSGERIYIAQPPLHHQARQDEKYLRRKTHHGNPRRAMDNLTLEIHSNGNGPAPNPGGRTSVPSCLDLDCTTYPSGDDAGFAMLVVVRLFIHIACGSNPKAEFHEEVISAGLRGRLESSP